MNRLACAGFCWRWVPSSCFRAPCRPGRMTCTAQGQWDVVGFTGWVTSNTLDSKSQDSLGTIEEEMEIKDSALIGFAPTRTSATTWPSECPSGTPGPTSSSRPSRPA